MIFNKTKSHVETNSCFRRPSLHFGRCDWQIFLVLKFDSFASSLSDCFGNGFICGSNEEIFHLPWDQCGSPWRFLRSSSNSTWVTIHAAFFLRMNVISVTIVAKYYWIDLNYQSQKHIIKKPVNPFVTLCLTSGRLNMTFVAPGHFAAAFPQLTWLLSGQGVDRVPGMLDCNSSLCHFSPLTQLRRGVVFTRQLDACTLGSHVVHNFGTAHSHVPR